MNELYTKLGLAFKAERENRELQLGDLSDELKISVPNLEAIENGKPDDLPSELYFKLFTKSYAERLGIDLIATIEAIKEELGVSLDNDVSDLETEGDLPAAHDNAGDNVTEGVDAQSTLFKLLLPATLAATVFGGLLFGLYALFFGNAIGNRSASETDRGQNFSSELIAFQSQLADYDWNIPTSTTVEPLTLTLSSVSESWATVLADGDTIIYRILIPGRVYTASANYRLRVSVGIPSVVAIKANGRDVNIRDTESRRISRVEINQVNVERFPDATSLPKQPASSPPAFPVGDST